MHQSRPSYNPAGRFGHPKRRKCWEIYFLILIVRRFKRPHSTGIALILHILSIKRPHLTKMSIYYMFSLDHTHF